MISITVNLMLQVYQPCSFFLLPQGSIHPRARCAWACTIRNALPQVHTLTIDQVLYVTTLYLTKTHANSIIARNQSNLTLPSEFLSNLTPSFPSNLKFYCSSHLWCSNLRRCLCSRWRAYQSCCAFYPQTFFISFFVASDQIFSYLSFLLVA